MATLWVSTLGSNANDGSTYALAKADVYAAIVAAARGDVINFVADGTYKLGTFSQAWGPIDGGFNGTDWDTNPGLTIRGCDETGAAAMVTMELDSSISAKYGFRIALATARYITFQGIRFDYSSGVGTSESSRGPIIFGTSLNTGQGVRVYDCEFKFGSTGADATGTPANLSMSVNQSGTAQVDGVEFARCVFDNINGPQFGAIGPIYWHIHHCVFIFTTQNALPASNFIGGTNVGQRYFYNNTIIRRGQAGDSTTLFGNNNADNSQTRCHSNFIYVDCGTSGTSTGVSGFILPGTNVSAATNTEMLGGDVFALGPNITPFVAGWTGTTRGYTSYAMNQNYVDGVTWTGGDVNPLSLSTTNVTLGGAFFDTTTTYVWTPDEYSHVLEWDMRPLIGRTTALDGGVPGAIQDITNMPPVIWGDQNWTVTAGDTISVDASSGLAEMSFDPDGDPLTWSVVDNVTHGTLNLVTGTGAYEYTPNVTYTGNDSFTWQVCDAVTCAIHIVDTAQRPSVLFYVAPYPVVPPGDDEPIAPVFLDVLPFFAPDLRVDALMRYTSKRNRLPYKALDARVQADRWIESTHRVIQIATNTSQVVTLGGIETARHIIIETDSDVEVSVNTNTAYWPVDGVAALVNTQVQSLHVRNTSTADEATVHIIAVD